MAVRIAHISDIHLERMDISVSDRLTSALVRCAPNLLVVSGDLVDNFWKLEKGKAWLSALCRALDLDPTKYVVIVPGNHDYRALGNFGFRPITGLWFRWLFGKWQHQSVRIFRDFGLTFFLIDSNPITFGFARGSVSRWQLRHIRREFEALPPEQRDFVRKSTKIAVMHHHPLPVPYEGGDTFLMLDKAQNVIQFLAEQRISCILHGHKHRAPHSLLSLGTCGGTEQVMQIIGAGTAVAGTDREARGHNFNLITVEDSGLICVQQYFAQPGRDFQEISRFPFLDEVVERVFERASATTGCAYDKIHWDCRIDAEGDTHNEMSYIGLRPFPGRNVTATDARTYSCDTGHMSIARLIERKSSPGVILDVAEREPRKIEFVVRFQIPPTLSNPVSFSLEQYDFNTIALDRESFRRKFPRRIDPVEYEEKVLTEVVREFSWALAFPETYKLDRPPRFEVLDMSEVRHDWLTQVLQPSFQFSEALGLAFVSLKKPPCGYRYRISWDLPSTTTVASVTNPGHVAEIERFAGQLLRERPVSGSAIKGEMVTVMRAFAHGIAEQIESLTQTPGVVAPDDLDISLMVYDDTVTDEPPRLRIIIGTQAGRGQNDDFALEIGDGNAGRAYARNICRAFDAERARTEPIYETYVQRTGRATHAFLYSIPLRHPVSQHLMYGVLNVGTYVQSQGNLLRVLNTAEHNEWLLAVAQEYVLKRFLEIVRM